MRAALFAAVLVSVGAMPAAADDFGLPASREIRSEPDAQKVQPPGPASLEDLMAEAAPAGFAAPDPVGERQETGAGSLAPFSEDRMTTAVAPGSADQASQPTAPPASKRYRVTARKVAIERGGERIGTLYRWAVFDARPGEAAGQLRLSRLVSGFLSAGDVSGSSMFASLAGRKPATSPLAGPSERGEPETASSAESPGSSDPVKRVFASLLRTPATTGTRDAHLLSPGACVRNPRLRVRGRLYKPQLALQVHPDSIRPPGGGHLVCVTPAEATLDAEAVEEIPAGETEPSGRRFESAEIEMRVIEVSSLEGARDLEEVDPDSDSLGSLRHIDYESGLAAEMEHYSALGKGRPLTVFLLPESKKNVPHAHWALPPIIRERHGKGPYEVRLLDETKARIADPLPNIVFPGHFLRESSISGLTAALKHELGHVLHYFAGAIRSDGTSTAFGAHNPSVRTADATAFVEGFAEYTEFKFRDSNRENNPGHLRESLLRNNDSAYKSLLFFYWSSFVRQPLLRRVPDQQLDALGADLSAMRWAPGPQPTLEQYQRRIVQGLAGKGEPPLSEEEVRSALTEHDSSNPDALANLRDEALTEDENRQLQSAFTALNSSLKTGGPNPASLRDGFQRLDAIALRSPQDLFMSEGAVAMVLLELDGELKKQGVDFYKKVLGALRTAPYESTTASETKPVSSAATKISSAGAAGRPIDLEGPPRPVNLKELLAVMNRDPELNGRIFPVVTRVTRGVLKPEHFRLARRRSEDSLVTAQPGMQPRASAGPVRSLVKSGLTSGGTETLRLEPASSAVTPAAPESEPGFTDLRGR